MLDQDAVDGMGLTFFCNSLVEKLFNFRQTGMVSPQLKEKAQWAAAEFQSLTWPSQESQDALHYLHRSVPYVLFNSNANLATLELVARAMKTTPGALIGYVTGRLDLVVSDAPIEIRKESAGELQEFFDLFGDYSYCSNRESVHRV
jgi:hypothetical protein